MASLAGLASSSLGRKAKSIVDGSDAGRAGDEELKLRIVAGEMLPLNLDDRGLEAVHKRCVATAPSLFERLTRRRPTSSIDAHVIIPC